MTSEPRRTQDALTTVELQTQLARWDFIKNKKNFKYLKEFIDSSPHAHLRRNAENAVEELLSERLRDNRPLSLEELRYFVRHHRDAPDIKRAIEQLRKKNLLPNLLGFVLGGIALGLAISILIIVFKAAIGAFGVS